jgi:uncharacterized protein YbjT (DUF2867 family)
VTGGTGTLGRLVVDRLESDGHSVAVLSRSSKPGVVTGDLVRNTGIDAAVAGMDVIVHCATGTRDVRATSHLLDAAGRAGTPHVVYISIVGVDRIPFPYYRQKLQCELMLAGSGLPFSLVRATQFHSFVASFFDAQRWFPALFVLSTPVQPVDASEVADVLADIAGREPVGRTPDFGGPVSAQLSEFADQWQRSRGLSRRQVAVRLPGAAFRGFRSGFHTTPEPVSGSVTFARFLDGRSGANPVD